MTELEKMAEESWRSRDYWSNDSDKAHMEGYLAGFRKAREMAADYVRSLNDRVESGLGDDEATEVLKIGESEVKDDRT